MAGLDLPNIRIHCVQIRQKLRAEAEKAKDSQKTRGDRRVVEMRGQARDFYRNTMIG